MPMPCAVVIGPEQVWARGAGPGIGVYASPRSVFHPVLINVLTSGGHQLEL